MFCKRCGTENGDNMSFCKECGAPLKEGRTPQIPSVPSPEPKPEDAFQGYSERANSYDNSRQNDSNPGDFYGGKVTEDMLPPEYEPISMWGYFGYFLLFSIPLAGFILMLVFSFGGTRNKNLKNMARGYLCMLVLMSVLFTVVFLAGASLITDILRYSMM